MRLVKLQISNFCFRFPFKHPDAIKQIEPSSKTAYAAPYQGLPVSHITWEGCCLHKQKKLTPSLLGFTSNFAGDCSLLSCALLVTNSTNSHVHILLVQKERKEEFPYTKRVLVAEHTASTLFVIRYLSALRSGSFALFVNNIHCSDNDDNRPLSHQCPHHRP